MRTSGSLAERRREPYPSLMRRSSILLLVGACTLGLAGIEPASAARDGHRTVEPRTRHAFAFSSRRGLALSSATQSPSARFEHGLPLVDRPRPIDRVDPWTGEVISEEPAPDLYHRVVVRPPRPIDVEDPWAPVLDDTVSNGAPPHELASND